LRADPPNPRSPPDGDPMITLRQTHWHEPAGEPRRLQIRSAEDAVRPAPGGRILIFATSGCGAGPAAAPGAGFGRGTTFSSTAPGKTATWSRCRAPARQSGKASLREVIYVVEGRADQVWPDGDPRRHQSSGNAARCFQFR
jgi:hypothetical protein